MRRHFYSKVLENFGISTGCFEKNSVMSEGEGRRTSVWSFVFLFPGLGEVEYKPQNICFPLRAWRPSQPRKFQSAEGVGLEPTDGF